MLAATWVLCARLGAFFRALDRFWVDFGGFGEVLGRVLEALETNFSIFFRTACSKLIFSETLKKPRKTNGFFNIFKKPMA